MGACFRDEKGTFVAALTTYCEAVMTIAGEVWVCTKAFNGFLH